MNMTNPVGPTPLDKPGLVGQPLDRIDGPLKVSGRATYAAEYHDEHPLYGFVVQAAISKGRLDEIDTTAAEKAPGVRLVLTYKNALKQGPRGTSGNPQLEGPSIDHHGQPIALVVADTFEQARAAAYLVKPRYAAEKGEYDMGSSLAKSFVPKSNNGVPADTASGDLTAAFTNAPVKVDVTYTTPPQTHAMMEPHATIAVWNGDSLTLYTANQMLMRGTDMVAGTLQIPKDKVRMVSSYIGGGFGGKLQVEADAILAAMAAKVLQKPVKVVLTRQQIFEITKHRTDTIQRVKLAAGRDGTLTAIGHESWSNNTPGDTFYESAAQATRSFYAAPNRMTAHRLVTLDLPHSSSMRAPGEAVGLLALECAMDELAAALNMDPIELRIKNEPQEDPEKGRPFSTRSFVPCLRKGAELFGWSKRNATPGQVKDGAWLVGMGMSGAIRGNPMLTAKASVTLDKNGIATVRSSMTDIGTGSYTILAQIAADMLSLPMARVRVALGDTAFPAAPGSGGSFGANSAGSAVYDACNVLRGKLLQAANLPPDSTFNNGNVTGLGRTVSLTDLVGPNGLEADGAADPGDSRKAFNQQSYGAHFAEVGVDRDTGEIRLRRMLGVFTAGRILNAKTARSQAIGGMTFGVGAALTEDLVIDKRFGGFVNHDLAEYHVAVHADIPAIDAVFLPELDDHSSAMKSKGIGELGICGAGAAVANAVYNATGVRIRDYPLTLDKVLNGWAAANKTGDAVSQRKAG
ncbi:xanthine dehydrogenase family protein molybdopterin-binding subunit [Lichenifustis flavocetrariae]|uniref:xanthine dehydrogenase family protein molybdopterin-binding subunit n=1 Tax=Lichenifustis flavocetrariae TaxID=2949735 RepID=UPI0024A6B2BF|nr:xanthine dehydrogenase family protein molybdopterin-binding subunit [Lichenifustis flavocetrariae]